MAKAAAERPTTTERKAVILAAALRCFCDLGVKQTTVQDIQRASGCSIGSIYHHFGSKEGVAEALFIDTIEHFNRGMLARLDRCDSAAGGVKAVVYFYCDWSAAHPDLARYLHSRDIDFSERARAVLADIRSRYIQAVFAWFGPFVSAGSMRLLPVDTYVPLISGPIQDYVRRWLAERSETPLDSVREIFAGAAWEAVRARS